MLVVVALGLLSQGIRHRGGIELEFALSAPADDALLLEVEPLLVDDTQPDPPAVAISNLALGVEVEQPTLDFDIGDQLALRGRSGPESHSALPQGVDQLAANGDSTSVFGLAAEGTEFVYLFDRSMSMTSVFTLYERNVVVRRVSPLGLAKAELLRSLHGLSESQSFQVVFYNHTTLLFGPNFNNRRLYRASPLKIRQATRFVEAMPGKGDTDHWKALRIALDLKPDAVFIITDAEDKDDLPLTRVRAATRTCHRDEIQINVVHFGDRVRPDSTLALLARETGGVHRFIELTTIARLTPGNQI